MFSEQPDKSWVDLVDTVVSNKHSNWVYSLTNTEAWGLVLSFRERLHPTALAELIEISDALQMFKMSLLAPVLKEFARFPEYDFKQNLELSPAWWEDQAAHVSHFPAQIQPV